MAYNPLDVFTGNVQQAAADKATAGIRQGMTDYGQFAGQGRDALSTNYTDALKQYQAMQPGAMGGYSAYGDATGANGPEGLARAAAQYRALPGYASLAQEAATAAARAGVAGGQATGNTLQGITDRTTDIFQRGFGDYANRLAPWANIAGNNAAGQAGVYTGLGQGLNQSFGNQANAFMGAQTNIGKENKEGELGKLTGYKNLFDFGQNAMKLAASAGTGGMGGALMGGLSGMFSNPSNTPLSGADAYANRQMFPGYGTGSG